MDRLNFLVVIVSALLVACSGSSLEEKDVAATRVLVAGRSASNFVDVMEDGPASRDLLRRKRKKNKRKGKKGKGSSESPGASSEAINLNDEGVLVNQQTTADIDGDGNVVIGGSTSPIFNGVVDLGDIDLDRKLLAASSNEDDVTVDGLAARALLRKRKRNKNKKKKNKGKGGSPGSFSAAENINDEGVLVNQQGAIDIEGDDNGVAVGSTDEIFNLNVDTEDIFFDRRRLQSFVSLDDKSDVGSDGSASRDLLRRRRRKKNKKGKGGKGGSSEASSAAANTNLEGVLINQQVSADIDGDGNGVVGGSTSDIFNIDVDTGDIDFP